MGRDPGRLRKKIGRDEVIREISAGITDVNVADGFPENITFRL